MADGTSRPIDRVQLGDLVVGNEGQANRVLEIEKPMLGPRTLYALNDGDYFVTAEHPFMTEQGWKSIDPAALADERSLLDVDRLTVGDRVLTLTGVAAPVGGPAHGEAMDVRVEATALERIVGTTADPNTALYNLRLDGNHTYFANGLLVHNK